MYVYPVMISLSIDMYAIKSHRYVVFHMTVKEVKILMSSIFFCHKFILSYSSKYKKILREKAKVHK